MRNAMPHYRNPMDLQSVIETIPALVVCALRDGTVEFVNRARQEYTGYSLQQLTDSGWRYIVHADDLAKFLDEWNIAVLADKPFETEARIRRSDGTSRVRNTGRAAFIVHSHRLRGHRRSEAVADQSATE